MVQASGAAIICPASPDKNQFWQGSAANILAAVLLWVAYQPGETKTLARARAYQAALASRLSL